jgi:hypothetical protein
MVVSVLAVAVFVEIFFFELPLPIEFGSLLFFLRFAASSARRVIRLASSLIDL